MCKTIKQKVKFKAPPRAVYDLLANEKKHGAFTGRNASISQKVGGRFRVDAGYASGIQVELTPGKRIVQAWRGSDFPVGVYSMASFNLKATRDGGTELVLTHRGVPKDLIPKIEERWRKLYWQRMKDYLSRD